MRDLFHARSLIDAGDLCDETHDVDYSEYNLDYDIDEGDDLDEHVAEQITKGVCIADSRDIQYRSDATGYTGRP